MNLEELFKALGDETRLRIIRLLFNGTFNANEIIYILNAKQPTISHHLKILGDLSVIISKKEGTLVYYQLNIYLPQEFLLIIKLIDNKKESIPNYVEDKKRLAMILEKRDREAIEYFDNIAKDFDSIQESLFSDIYSADEVFAPSYRAKNILEIGCGTGRNLPILANYCDKVIGLDSSPKMIQIATHVCQKNNLNYELIIGDSRELPFSSGSIDAIFMSMFLHHMTEPEKVIDEVYRVLSNKGRFFLIELLSHDDESMRKNYADFWLGFSEADIYGFLKRFSIDSKIIKKSESSEKSVIIIEATKKFLF